MFKRAICAAVGVGVLLIHATALPANQEKPSGRVAPYGLIEKFRIAEHDFYPENIAYDPVSGDYFLGSMSHPRIIRIKPDGSYEDFVSGREAGLLSVIGMKVDPERRLLWACTGRFTLLEDYDQAPKRTGVVKFDIDGGARLGEWMVDQESDYHIFNDLTVAMNGDVYATTTLIGSVYRWAVGADTMELVHQLEPGRHNNGIALDANEKYVFMTVDRSICRLELATGELIEVSIPDDGALGTDGLYVYGRSLISVKPRFGRVSQIFLTEDLCGAEGVIDLAKENGAFAYATTGVVVADKLVFVATSFANTPRNANSAEQHGDVLIYEVTLQRADQ